MEFLGKFGRVRRMISFIDDNFRPDGFLAIRQKGWFCPTNDMLVGSFIFLLGIIIKSYTSVFIAIVSVGVNMYLQKMEE